MKFGQLIEYNRLFFLKNHMHNVVEKLFPDPFLKSKVKIQHISRSMPRCGLLKYIETKLLNTCFYLI